MKVSPPAPSPDAPPTPSVLIVEDSPTLAQTYMAYLGPLNGTIELAETGATALNLLSDFTPSVVLLDLKLPDMHGLDILRHLQTSHHPAKVIVITAHGSVATAVEAMREGAVDFLLKPFSAERLMTTTRNALELARLSNLVAQYKGSKERDFESFIGISHPMQSLYQTLSGAAPSRASVFITGESGSGKELAAEAIHQLSPRRVKNFVALNCAAIPANLIESEIFGHQKGAFTGATTDRVGAAIRADGGTLFLDEICDMPLDLQAKLLRFIQTGQVVPVGSNTTQRVDVRFVCATNKDPCNSVRAGDFREDLYYRLHVIPVHIPPLRERGDDILRIAHEMMLTFTREENKSFTHLSPNAESMLMSHSWPGNVRELGNLMQSAVVLNDGTVLTEDMLAPMVSPSRVRASTPRPTTGGQSEISREESGGPRPAFHQADIIPLAEVEKQAVVEALSYYKGHVCRTAEALDVHSSTLYRKLRDWDIDPRSLA